MTAATVLAKAGRSVVVLEARDRVGGPVTPAPLTATSTSDVAAAVADMGPCSRATQRLSNTIYTT
ncbi:FAD-dependent oxidoreductase [Kribbella speibonae]|uniref:FAD-dependent oxidoreductase n=1 Tax=Kribbella speibonae TaxID=1572660 RepID=UPI003B849680